MAIELDGKRERTIPLFRRLKPEAERLLGELNPQGRAAYRLQFAAQAGQQLDEALRAGSIEALRTVGRRYFHTPAGADATYLAAVRFRVQGEPMTASLLFARLKSLSWDAERFEPSLSLQLATCYDACGLHDDAQRLAHEIRARWGDLSQLETPAADALPPRNAVGEQAAAEGPGADRLPPETVDFLNEQVLSLADDAPAGDWKLYRGNARRNGGGATGGAYLAGWPAALPVRSRFAGAEELYAMIESLDQSYRSQRQTAIPTLQPLVVGSRVVIRTPVELQAIDLATGRLIWTSAPSDVLRDVARRPRPSLLAADDDGKEILARGLRRRIWDDPAFGRLSSDGERVFSVESHTLGVEGEIQRLVVRDDGSRQLDAGPLRGHNTLGAYDAETGKLLWEIGGADDEQTAEPLAGLYFLGPPLPLAGDLRVIAARDHETLLLTLDPRDGALRHSMVLETRTNPTNPYVELYSPMWLLDKVDHRCGASPAFAGGVIVCRLSLNRYAAIDPVDHSVLWRFDPEEAGDAGGGNAWNNWQRKLLDQANRNPADHWVDATPTIDQDKVILAPSDRDELFCLQLRDGKLLWRAPRHDGMYVAGVDRSKVVVVGRGGVRAYDLSTGAALWGGAPVELPPGATPSGIGYFHEHSYYLPLTTAEIARLDLERGEIAARSRSPDAIVPGNTIAVGGRVITQSPLGTWIFPSLSDRRQSIAPTLAADPGNAAARVALGEALLYQGKLREAIDQLNEALRMAPHDTQAAELLATASLEGLRTDYEAFRDAAARIVGAAHDPATQFRFLQEQALARERAGEPVAALESWLAAVRLNFRPEELIYAAASRSVRRDRYLAARLEMLYRSLDASQRPQVEAALAHAIGPLTAAERLQYFSWHDFASRTRLDRAAELAAGQREGWLRAELLLRSVIAIAQDQEGQAAEHEGEAVARLADLLARAGRNHEAARCYRRLNTELADVICLEGKTGGQLHAALADDSPLARVADSRDYWPVGNTHTTVAKSSGGYNYRYLVPTEFAAEPLAVRSYVEIDTAGRQISGVDRFGGQAWNVSLPETSDEWRYNNSIYTHSSGSLQGHLLLVWAGNRVAAIDLLNRGEQPLWLHDTHTAKPPAPGMRKFLPMKLQGRRSFEAGSQFAYSPLAMLDDCICFQQERTLLAVDGLTGSILWRIDEVAEYSSLVSLGNALVVLSSDREQATVYSGANGRAIARRGLPPAAAQIGWIAGRLIYWRDLDHDRELVAYDPLTNRETFRHRYSADAHATAVPGGQLGVLDDEQGLHIWQLPAGKLALSAQCELPADLLHMVVAPSEDSYTLLTCVSGFENSPFSSSQAMFGFVEVHGPAFGFERGSGRQLWETKIENQQMRLHQPADLPLLVFRNQRYRPEGDANHTEHTQLIVDRRSGAVLHRDDNAANSHFLYQTKVDLDRGVAEVHCSREKVTLHFKGEPAKTEP